MHLYDNIINLLPVCDARKQKTDVSPVEDSQITSTDINITKISSVR